jgi:hypothetical protein
MNQCDRCSYVDSNEHNTNWGSHKKDSRERQRIHVPIATNPVFPMLLLVPLAHWMGAVRMAHASQLALHALKHLQLGFERCVL